VPPLTKLIVPVVTAQTLSTSVPRLTVAPL
jgi:hypothetical protein